MRILNRTSLQRLLPHGERMCLLDTIHHWDDTDIDCSALSHRDPTNPLRNETSLPAVCGLEYAAQAMAAHRALVEPHAKPKHGFLAAVRTLELHIQRLDTVDSALWIHAHCLLNEPNGAIYTFSIAAQGKTLLCGQVSVYLAEIRKE